MQLAITHVIDVSINEVNAGINAYNTSNILIFTPESAANSFGNLGYAVYSAPTQVGVDFGTTSRAYLMANAGFSQQPNILQGGGQLIVMQMIVSVFHLALSAVAASGTFELVFDQGTTAAINWNDTAAQIQAKINVITGLEEVTVTGSIASQSLNITMYKVHGAATAVTVTSNSLETAGSAGITFTITTPTTGETLDAAITRAAGIVQFFGTLQTFIPGQVEMLAAGAVIQALNKMEFFVSRTASDVVNGGQLDLLRSGGLTHSRGLLYIKPVGSSASDTASLEMSAAYAFRGLSVDFTGSNTTITMNLQQLSTIQPDDSMTETIYTNAKAAGADIYPSIQGDPGVLSFNANGGFFDEIYNSLAFAGDLQVAGFNFLAQAGTKIPQTENGMTAFKGALRRVCRQYVTNQYIAPGAWTSPVSFGNQDDFLNNIEQLGYYIYSVPVAQQSAAARAARQAPLIQIAIKEAGAIQSGNIIVNINP